MSKPKRKKLDFNKESVRNLLQEAYNDLTEQQQTAKKEFFEISKQVEDLDDVQAVGKVKNDLLKIVDASIEKKIQISKIMATISGAGQEEEVVRELTEEEKKELREAFQGVRNNRPTPPPAEQDED